MLIAWLRLFITCNVADDCGAGAVWTSTCREQAATETASRAAAKIAFIVPPSWVERQAWVQEQCYPTSVCGASCGAPAFERSPIHQKAARGPLEKRDRGHFAIDDRIGIFAAHQ